MGRLIGVKIDNQQISCQPETAIELQHEPQPYGEIEANLSDVEQYDFSVGDKVDGIQLQDRELPGYGIVTKITSEKIIITLYL